MPLTKTPIVPCLWYDSNAEEAVNFYLGIFPNSAIKSVSRYTEVGREFHGKEPGTALTIEFTLDGQTMTALNGGPMFKFTEAVSLQIMCDTQEEIDHFWEKLSAGGDPAAQQCGWLKDKYGLSWQVVPKCIGEMMVSPDTEKSGRVMTAIFGMKKLDKAALEAAFAG
jgi:predicted 3-demethylubiquinone-9 3-methyltransferase (glyoxalase superfamily)